MTLAAPLASGSATDAVESVLAAVWEGAPAVVVPSPPGAGKTGLVERAVTLCCNDLNERVAVSCQTGAQTFDLTRRLSQNYPSMTFTLFIRNGGTAPPDLDAAANVSVVDTAKNLPEGPCVVVGTSMKWEYAKIDEPFDLLVVDEAWQLPDYQFMQIARIGSRYLLVGDPGQIAPVITADVRRWAHRVDGPHRPTPDALLVRRPDDVTVVALPATRRLGQPTVDVIQPVFYPTLPFRSIRPDRSFLSYQRGSRTDGLLTAASRAEIVAGVLPAGTPGVSDELMASTCATLITDTLDHGSVFSEDGTLPLGVADVGVVCAHVAQVSAVQAALGPTFREVRVDTAERWQGQEAEFMVVWHPLSGRPEATDFGRDAGRLCVMLSRHRCACVVLWREGTDSILARGGTGTRVLGDPLDRTYAGWVAHTELFKRLERHPVQG